MQISHADGTEHPHDANGNPVETHNTSNGSKTQEQWVGKTEPNNQAVQTETQSFPLAGVIMGALVLLVLVVVVSLYTTRRRLNSK